jgi:hypothetical protein
VAAAAAEFLLLVQLGLVVQVAAAQAVIQLHLRLRVQPTQAVAVEEVLPSQVLYTVLEQAVLV